MTLNQAPLAYSNPSSLPTIDLILTVSFSFGFAVVYFIYLERKRKRIEAESHISKEKMKTSKTPGIHRLKIDSVEQTSKFRKYSAVGSVAAALLSITFGAEYYWNGEGPTSPFEFFAGSIFVIIGVAAIGFALRHWALSRSEK